jgi:1,4-dihydroxy-2-naphthoyl-CoA hydrolase
MTQPTIDAIMNQAPSRFMEASGLRFTQVSGTCVRGEIQLGPEHHTPWGAVHGGVYTSAVEAAASLGASIAVADRDQFAVGVANSTDFVRPISSGAVEVVGEAIHQGRSQQLWQVTITSSENGKLVARGQLRLANVSAAGSPNAS